VNPKQGKAVPDARQIFRVAAVYEEASNVIHNAMSNDKKMYLAVTHGAIAAFALELYLKCLLVIEHNAAPPEEHNPKELFRLLRRQTKQSLRRQHNEWAPKQQAFQNLKKHIPDWEFDLDSLLEQAQDAFTQLRYSYEGLREGMGFSLNGFTWFVRNRILKLHPEWATS
jgi:hypothetical protein